MSENGELFNIPPDVYGPAYGSHALEQYKLYVEMADRISSRRQVANSFFFSINTGILAFLQLSDSSKASWAWAPVVGICGGILSYAWYRLVRSYKDLNTAKFKVIDAMESRLPLSPYRAEWVQVGQGQDPSRYLPFTRVELTIPWIFISMYGFLMALTLWERVCQP